MNEKISALIDDEITIEEASHLITKLHSSKQGAEAWVQYHLIGDAMRGSSNLSANFIEKLMEKLELEPTVLAPNAALLKHNNERTKHYKISTSWSIAASVVAGVMVSWMALHQTTPSMNDQLALLEQKGDTQTIPAEYLLAHQTTAPLGSAYYMQTVSYSE